MKILVLSDLHLDWQTYGIVRKGDLTNALYDVLGTIIQHKVDRLLFLGDFCNPDSGSRVFGALEILLGFLFQTAFYKVQSYWLTGNHDIIQDGSNTSTLEPLKAIFDSETGGKIFGSSKVIDEPTFLTLGEGVHLLAFPYTPSDKSYDLDKFVAKTLCDSDITGTVIIAGHLTIPGIGPGSESLDMARGRDIEFPLEAIRAARKARHDLEFILMNGHYHKAQSFEGIIIPGSLERLTFNEEKNPTGWYLLEIG
jgi:DNA repair exonuclease SbcCD nuclease subunit